MSLSPFIFWILGLIVVGDSIPTNEPFFNILGISVLVAVLFQLIFYVLNVFKNTTISKNNRILWNVLLIGGNIIVFPFYWYFHILNDRTYLNQKIDHREKIKDSGIRNVNKGNKIKVITLIAGFIPIILGTLSILTAFYVGKNITFYMFALLTIASAVALICIYICNVLNNVSVDKEERVLWIVLFVLSNVLIFPFYWYFHIWRETNTENPRLSDG